jgi:hypothetical protein
LDLAVANGHLDDYPHTSGLKKMPTQFFRNTGDGQFVELDSTAVGSYFQRPQLGRALARLDWNRDGLPDFCVTHVATPFALLTNQTQQSGNHLVVHLRATRSARDAIGAVVSVRVNEQTRLMQLTAGDGYQASNQRILVFGLSNASQIDELVINWPSGTKQIFTDVEVNREIMCVEDGLLPMPIR